MALVFMTSCTHYQPLDLDASPAWPTSVTQLRTHLQAQAHPELPASWQAFTVQPEAGLNEIALLVLALANNPHLVAIQSQMLEARATLKQTGLLPDPQFSMGLDQPQSAQPPLQTAYSFSLGFDLQSLILHDARISSASEQARAAYLQTLWQEWQIIQQTRILYRRWNIQSLQVAHAHQQFLQTEMRWQDEKNALRQGNATLDQEGLSRASVLDAELAWLEAQRQQRATAHDIALLLGLDPQAKLTIIPPLGGIEQLLSAPLKEDELWQTALHRSITHRPDLLALQAGYMAQEGRVREQVLAQFPNFSISLNRLRDTGGIWSLGPVVNLNLPLLNRNQGNIDVARATRQRLKDEYHDQWLAAYGQIIKLMSDQRLLYAEYQAITAQSSDNHRLTQRMSKALASGDTDMLTFTTLRNSDVARQARKLTLEQTLLEQAVALDTLMGSFLITHPLHKERQP